MRPLLKRFLPLVVIALGILGFVLLRMTRPEPPPAGDEERRWPVAVLAVQPGDYAPRLRLFGELTSDTSASLKARTAGDVAEILVEEGQAVSEGDLLLRLDDLDARAAFNQAKAGFQEAQSTLEQFRQQHQVDLQLLEEERERLELAERQGQRLEQLFAANRASRRDLEQAQLALSQQKSAFLNRQLAVNQFPSREAQLEANLARAETQLEQAQRNLEATRLKAPADLRVEEIFIGVRDQVAPQQALVSVFVPSALELQARIPVSYVALLQKALDQGEKLVARSQPGDHSLVFTLQELAGRTRDAAGIQALFKLTSGNPEGLALGRFIDAELLLPRLQAVFWVPAAAVQGRNRIYRVVDERLEGLNVELEGQLELQGEPGVLIRSDELVAGDQVLANRLPNAMDSLLVEVVETRTLAGAEEAEE
ncbi:efflux RND transporter periplasmic adaptor subunit [Marinospirillum perlucidum]|uniref:efflux RND transporter periplasmic adaptor subunit n=1 Tax=Marinospirillum perlucidum TaxID=1982602 RepID=UPI000DF21FCC|nr:HlyD family efflux transporter periplasmic adaptor subunit [Marinospirillum perlucidum]